MAGTDPGSAPPAAPPAAAPATRAEQLARHYAERIARRLINPGARLPSVRDCAARHRVSPGTVVAAYDLLQARGLVQARPQRGYYVRDAAAGAAAPAARAALAVPAP
ncbi:MAG: winged helix-turn-helix transcriptional regulator, partial [Burkholderiales bacterium]|nr:winged helix-turn-helix transcriptional regulator [Burkholderiales bacterium]